MADLDTEQAAVSAPEAAPIEPSAILRSETFRILDEIKASTFTPIYEPLDLGTIAPEFSGQTVQVLRNPSRRFRRTFLSVSVTSEEFPEWVAYIFQMSVEQAEAWLDTIDQGLSVFLFVPLAINNRYQQCALVELWNTYAIEAGKKYHALLSLL